MKEIIKLQEELDQKKNELVKKYGIQSISIDSLRINAYTELAYINFWYDDDINGLEIKKSCGDKQPETVEEFKAYQEQFEKESALLRTVAEDFKRAVNED